MNRSRLVGGRLALVVTLFVAACAGPSQRLVLGKEPRDIGKAYRVTPTLEWSRFQDRLLRAELWTINGPRLEAIRFYHGIRKEGSLLRVDSDAHMPTFEPGMSGHEVMELVVDTFSRTGAARVEPANLRPAPFGELDGFRFEFSYVSDQGLNYRGLAMGAQTHDKRLLLILFTAAEAHYYPTYLPEVERILASVETTVAATRD